MPVLETERLLVRPFSDDDLEACHQLLNHKAWHYERPVGWTAEFLQWSRSSNHWLAELRQPPYGDRAVVRKSTNELVGSVGIVPSYGPFDRLPSCGGNVDCEFMRPEVGLFWATRTTELNRGYATEAAHALVGWLFSTMRLHRVIATTTYDNLASQAVMRHLGMSVERNPREDPPWFQVVGVLQNTLL